MIAKIYQRILGQPFVYEKIRPLVVGGINMESLYSMLDTESSRIVLDVGCGTGDALRYLRGFERYVGMDTDPLAIEHARTHRSGPGIEFECRTLRPEDVATIAPTSMVLSGVLHHLPDEEAVDLLRMGASSPALVRIVTSDIVYLPDAFFNNLLASLDRGKYCRNVDGYLELAKRAGLVADRREVVDSQPGSSRVQYFLMSLRKP